MRAFKDANNRDWLIDINVSAIKLVRAYLKGPDDKPFDLLRLTDNGMKGLAELLADPILLIDVIWVLCKAQAEKVNPPITDEQFGQAMYGDAIDRATAAFLDALIDFFPSEKDRAALRDMQKKQKDLDTLVSQRQMEMITLVSQKQMEKLQTMDLQEEADKILKEVESRLLNGSSTAVPASAASTPAPERSGN